MRKILGLTALFVLAAVLSAGCKCPFMPERHEGHMRPMLSGVLDGKTFVGDIGMKGEAPGMRETITFRDGYFHSSACDMYHFGDGAYLAVPSGDMTTFMAQTWNRRGATIVWKGTVKGDSLEATMTLYEKGKSPDERWAKAKAQ